jgi:hypothetical protein
MTAESRNSGPGNDIHCYATVGKHVSIATETRYRVNSTRATARLTRHATIEELLEVVFSARSLQGYKVRKYGTVAM